MEMNENAVKLVSRLKDLQSEIGRIQGVALSDSDFARRFLTFSATTWSKVQSGTYNGGNLASVVDKLHVSVDNIERRLSDLVDVAKYNKCFVGTQLARATINCVDKARSGVDGKKIVVVLAPTGHGKSAIGNHLKGQGAICVEGSQAWRSSYKSFCMAVAAAAGKRVPVSASEARAEDEMIQALSSRAGTLFIDEANTMSGACANAIKYIVNKTDYTVIIAAIPEMWDKFLHGSEGEVKQLVNRCQPIVRSGDRISESDVTLFLRKRGLPVSFARPIARQASQFGGFRTVISVMNELCKIDSPTEDDLEKELMNHRQNFVASGLGK